jgi:hypothetical protein
LSHSHVCKLTNGRKESPHLARGPSPVSQSTSKLARLRPPKPLHQGLEGHLQTPSIAASKCLSKLAQLRPRSSHNHGLQVHISRFARLWPASETPNLLNHGLQVHLRTCSITAFKCISVLARLRPPSLHDRELQVHLQTDSITALEGISKFTRSTFSGTPRIALRHRL